MLSQLAHFYKNEVKMEAHTHLCSCHLACLSLYFCSVLISLFLTSKLTISLTSAEMLIHFCRLPSVGPEWAELAVKWSDTGDSLAKVLKEQMFPACRTVKCKKLCLPLSLDSWQLCRFDLYCLMLCCWEHSGLKCYCS